MPIRAGAEPRAIISVALVNFATQSYTFTPSGFGPEVGVHDPRSEAYIQQSFVGQAGRNFRTARRGWL